MRPADPIDVTARLLAERVKDSLGTVIIENRPGGGGNIGADAVAKAAPDGLTIGISAVATHAINPWLFAKMPYDAAKDFAPITQMVRVPNVLVMNAETAARLKINTLRDLIAYGKANPGKLNYGSGGNGSAGHLAGEMFKQGAGIFAVHIPYNGGNPAQLALLSGQVDFNFDNLATAAPNIRAGKLKALAVTTLTRSPGPARRAAGGRHPEGLRDRHLVGPGGAGRHAQGRDRQAQPCICGGVADARSQDPVRRADGRARHQQPGRIRHLHEGRTGQVRKSSEALRRQGGLSRLRMPGLAAGVSFSELCRLMGRSELSYAACAICPTGS